LHAGWLSVFWLDPDPVVDCGPDALLVAKVTLGGPVPLAARRQLLQERLRGDGLKRRYVNRLQQLGVTVEIAPTATA
jgi:hypothetical protein